MLGGSRACFNILSHYYPNPNLVKDTLYGIHIYLFHLLLGSVLPAAAADGHQEADQQALDYPALAAAIRSHAATDSEVAALCRDLQVLGRSEFKQLLRWRLTLRKDLKQLLGAAAEGEAAKKGSHKKQQAADGGEAGDDESAEEGDAETKLLAEMAAVKESAEKRLVLWSCVFVSACIARPVACSAQLCCTLVGRYLLAAIFVAAQAHLQSYLSQKSSLP